MGAGRKILRSLRMRGVAAEMDHRMSSLKSQLRRADRLGVPFVLLLGKDERARGTATLRNMKTGEEREVALDSAAEAIRQLAGS
jgi:histidyl-tRNA synthetase